MFRSISQLEAYYWVAKLGSFQAAADRLGVSQPSISQRIKELEEHIGAAIFTRDSRGARLTEQGNIMFDHIDKVMTLLNEVGDHFKGGDTLKGVLRIGIPDSFAEACLSSFLHLLEIRHPDLLTSIRVNNSRVLLRLLEEGSLDIAIVMQPKLSSAYSQVFLGSSEVIWVASPDFGIDPNNVDPLFLSRQRIITNPFPSPTHTVLMDWFAQHALVPAQVSTCDNVSTMARVTMDGKAISIITSCIIKRQLEEGSLVKLNVNPPVPNAEMYIVYPKRAMNKGMGKIAQIIRESIVGTGFAEGI